MTPVVLRSEAVTRGLRHYFTGKPCKHGHVAVRWTNSRICSVCLRGSMRTPKARAQATARWNKYTHPEKMLMWAKYRHVRKAYPGTFDLTIEAIDWPSHCPALGIPLKYAAQRDKNADDAPTLDRIDPRFGYVIGNVQVISRRANRIKNDGTPAEIMRVARFVNCMGRAE